MYIPASSSSIRLIFMVYLESFLVKLNFLGSTEMSNLLPPIERNRLSLIVSPSLIQTVTTKNNAREDTGWLNRLTLPSGFIHELGKRSGIIVFILSKSVRHFWYNKQSRARSRDGEKSLWWCDRYTIQYTMMQESPIWRILGIKNESIKLCVGVWQM